MRMRLQFGLKSFLIATSLIAMLLGTLGKQVYVRWKANVALRQSIEKREKARRGLTSLGANLGLREEAIVSVQFPLHSCKAKDFQWLSDLETLESLDLSHAGFRDSDVPAISSNRDLKKLRMVENIGFTNEGLASIGQLTSLETLDLSLTEISDEGLRAVGAITSLTDLRLSHNRITSTGISNLHNLQKLRILELAKTDVDDAALATIGTLRELRLLNLYGTKVRGNFAALRNCPNLKTLHLQACPLEDGSGLAELDQVIESAIEGKLPDGFLSSIDGMDRLRTLTLDGSPLKDSQLGELADARQITRLNLCRTSITDEGLNHLASLKQLKNLNLIKTEVSDDGVRSLAEHLPKTVITTTHGVRRGLTPRERRQKDKTN